MLRSLNKLASTLFYTLGISFFTAYLLVRTEIMSDLASWWMRIADLPIALVACVYGGTSLYLSVANPEKHSRALALVIGIPLVVLFVFLVALNFWEVLGLPIANY